MKRSVLNVCLLPIVLGCGTEDLTQPAGNGGLAATGGSMGQTGGAPGAGTGGVPVSSSGASSGGSAGAASGGGGGGSSGGSAGTATAGAGGSAAGGSAGAGGGGNAIADVAGKLDGFLFIAPCGDNGTGYDCTNSKSIPAPQNSPACADQNPKTTSIDLAIGGDAGKVYDVTLHVYGIVEAKRYQGGMRRDGNNMNASNTGGDFWYVGGSVPNSTYNSYELHVTPKVEGAANDYFLNSRNDTNEGHESWALNYTATIPVTGGGKVNFRVYDSNCRQIMNCGPGTGSSSCKAPRTLDLSVVDPKPPASFSQPLIGEPSAPGQWVFIDVTAVVPK